MKKTALIFIVLLILCAFANIYAKSEIPQSKPTKLISKSDYTYSYGSRKFTALIDESCLECNAKQNQDFYDWFNKAYLKSKYFYKNYQNIELNNLLDTMKTNISSVKDPAKRTTIEISFAAWMHRMVKTVIPRFSLDRGFEFYNVMKLGERQCLLQSVLMAGMLQRAGIDAGAAMVFRNIAGAESNNGHVVTLIRLSNGDNIVLDASEQVPFVNHQGLLVRSLDYTYVRPAYRKDSSRISGYFTETGNKHLSNKDVRPLNYDYMRSQFWFYRGERVKGGLLYTNKTAIGLKSEERALLKSVKLCPYNPLSTYILGRTYLAEGNREQAIKYLKIAEKMYKSYGWSPPGEGEYMTQAARLPISK